MSDDRDSSDRESLEERLRQATSGRYVIQRCLGVGGMGEVFLAQDKLARAVAIKVLAPRLMVSPEFEQRFFREARTVARFRHPNLVDIYDYSGDEGLLYFVMRYLPGRSLSDVCGDERKLSPDVVRAWLHQITDALDYAHSRAVIHRDVKPSNVLLDEEGNAVLTDFGIAEDEESDGLTNTGMIVGSPHYISPERWSGMKATPATDQYSLGIVAYEMLTGEPPFQGTMLAVMAAHAAEAPPSIRAARPDCPSELAALVEQMLAKRAEDRWDNLRAICDVLGTSAISATAEERASLAKKEPVGDPFASLYDGHGQKTVAAGVTIALRGGFLATAGDPPGDFQVAWSSSDPAIATVTPEGIVQTHRPGEVAISAIAEGHSRTLSLRVGPKGIVPGDPTAVESPSTDRIRGRRATRWISISATAATAALGLGALGWAFVNGSFSGGDSAENGAPALDPSPIVASVALLGPGGPIEEAIELTVGDSTTLTAEASTESGERVIDAEVTMQSSDPLVASVFGGVLIARAAGEALITAQIAGIDFESVRVLIRERPELTALGVDTVTSPPPPLIASIQLGGGPLVLDEGDSVSVPPVVVLDEDGSVVPETSPAFAVADPRIGRVVSSGWLFGLEPGSSWLTAQVSSLRDSVPLQVIPVAVEIATASVLELPVDSSVIATAALLDRRGNTLPGGDFVWASLTPDLVQVDQATGRMVGRSSGPGRVVVSSQVPALSDTIIVIVIAIALPAPPLPDLPDRNAVIALAGQCFEGIEDRTEEDLRTRLGGGDDEVLSSLLAHLNRELRFEEIEAREPAVRRSDQEAYSNVRARLSWSSGFGRRESSTYRVIANMTWDGEVWQSMTCSVWPN